MATPEGLKFSVTHISKRYTCKCTRVKYITCIPRELPGYDLKATLTGCLEIGDQRILWLNVDASAFLVNLDVEPSKNLQYSSLNHSWALEVWQKVPDEKKEGLR